MTEFTKRTTMICLDPWVYHRVTEMVKQRGSSYDEVLTHILVEGLAVVGLETYTPKEKSNNVCD
jgi:hypothetical protein